MRNTHTQWTRTTLCALAFVAMNAPLTLAMAQSTIVTSVLPSSRSIAVGGSATFFATIVNSGSSDAIGCSIAPGTSVDAAFFFQETEPGSNALQGVANAPVDISAGGFQTFLFGYEPLSAFAPLELELTFDCENTEPAPTTNGLNTVLLAASDVASPDIVALAATPNADGIVTASPAGAFSVASVNLGAGADVAITADTGGVNLPLSISLCQTDTATGACVNPTAPSPGSVSTIINAGDTPTFAVFVSSTGDVAFDPGRHRIFVRFKDTSGATRGSTSVAVRSLAPEPDGGEVITGPTGDINTPAGGTIGSVTTPLSAQQFANQFSAPPGRPSAPPNTIAYIKNGANGPNLRLINANGTNDRSLTTLPSTTRYAGDLSWRPDGTEVSFVADFEVGVLSSDLYAITTDGANLRRLTNVPRPIAYPNYPQGKAQLTILHPQVSGGVVVGYIEGGQQAFGWLATSSERRLIEYALADFGDGIVQTSIVRNVGCFFDLAANIDVIPGTTSIIPQQLPPGSLSLDDGCPLNLSPQWLDNDQILYTKRRGHGVRRVFGMEFSLTRGPADGLGPLTDGDEFAKYREDFNIVHGSSNEVLSVRINPNRSTDELMLLSRVGSPVSTEPDRVYFATFTDPAQSRLSGVATCPENLGCDLADAQFLPSGRGFVYSTLVTDTFSGLISSSLRTYIT